MSSTRHSILDAFLALVLAALCLSTALAAPTLETRSSSSLSNVTTTFTELDKRVTHSGQATWFEPGLGACGKYNNRDQLIVAISGKIWNKGGNCGQYASVTASNGKHVYVKVVDECPPCSEGSLDLSPAAFKKLAPLGQGVQKISWHYMPKGFKP